MAHRRIVEVDLRGCKGVRRGKKLEGVMSWWVGLGPGREGRGMGRWTYVPAFVRGALAQNGDLGTKIDGVRGIAEVRRVAVWRWVRRVMRESPCIVSLVTRVYRDGVRKRERRT